MAEPRRRRTRADLFDDDASFIVPAGVLVAGVDEAGRGPLAGPVCAAAVILDPERPIDGLADSKVLNAATRDLLAVEIRAKAHAYAVAYASVEEIDELNILHATMLAMRRAVMALERLPHQVWVDGNRCPTVPYRSRAIVSGDARVPAISAASILAKTSRDALLLELELQFPGYGFARHKGYPTPDHLDALMRLGPLPVHRRSFAPVQAAASRHGRPDVSAAPA